MVRGFLVARGLLTPEQRFTQASRETFLELRGSLRHLVETNEGGPASAADVEVFERLGLEAGLHPHFHIGRPPTLQPRAEGVAAAFGTVVAIVFLASSDGALEHLKLCAAEDCRSVFYDRSKNRSGRWCSMDVCGNRAKVRAWRERQKAAT